MRLFSARSVLSRELKTTNFNHWHSDLDDALRLLPESDIFPHELFRDLIELSDPSRRKLILVTERGEPVAVAGLRNRWGHWEPVTQWIVPGVLFPVKDGYIARVLSALGVELKVGWWRWQIPPPQIQYMSNAISEPTYGVNFTEDFEKHWRMTSHLRNVRTYRNRCKEFELKVNPPGGAELIISNWDKKWRSQGTDEASYLSERLLVAHYLQERGLHYSLLLFNEDEPVAGGTLIIHRNEAVAQCSYRNPKYDWYGAMTRHIDLTFTWAKNMGFDKFDLGGSQDYKKMWAPENGMKWKFDICPDKSMLESCCKQSFKANAARIGMFFKEASFSGLLRK